MSGESVRAARAKDLRYKKPALATMGYEPMREELEEIVEACSEVRWFLDTPDGDDLLYSVIGDEDQSWEFKMAFSALSNDAEQLWECVMENIPDPQEFDDCTVALVGNRYEMIGYDDYQEDYYALTQYQFDLAISEAGKRIMRKTKAELLSTVGQCVGIMFAFYDLRQKYDYLQATMDIIRGDNLSVLKVVKEIEKLYAAAQEEEEWKDENKRAFDKLLAALPQRVWLE